MVKRPEPKVNVIHEGKGVLAIESRRKDSEKLVRQRTVLSHINAGKLKGFKPRPGHPILIPLVFNKHAGSSFAEQIRSLRADIKREIGLIKSGMSRQHADQKHIIAHFGAQDKVYSALERLSVNNKGNISHERLEAYGIPSAMVRDIENGGAKLEIKFDSDGKVSLDDGHLHYQDTGGDDRKKRLSEEELARVLLAFNQLSSAQILRKAI